METKVLCQFLVLSSLILESEACGVHEKGIKWKVVKGRPRGRQGLGTEGSGAEPVRHPNPVHKDGNSIHGLAPARKHKMMSGIAESDIHQKKQSPHSFGDMALE